MTVIQIPMILKLTSTMLMTVSNHLTVVFCKLIKATFAETTVITLADWYHTISTVAFPGTNKAIP